MCFVVRQVRATCGGIAGPASERHVGRIRTPRRLRLGDLVVFLCARGSRPGSSTSLVCCPHRRVRTTPRAECAAARSLMPMCVGNSLPSWRLHGLQRSLRRRPHSVSGTHRTVYSPFMCLLRPSWVACMRQCSHLRVVRGGSSPNDHTRHTLSCVQLRPHDWLDAWWLFAGVPLLPPSWCADLSWCGRSHIVCRMCSALLRPAPRLTISLCAKSSTLQSSPSLRKVSPSKLDSKLHFEV